MKTVVALMVAVVAMVLGSGCMNAAETARRYASHDLQCPVESIRTHEIGPGAFVARGCGRRTFYIDNNAPTEMVSHRTTGRTYVTLSAKQPDAH